MLGEVTGFWTYIWLRRESLSLYLANDALEASVRGRDAGAAHAVLLSADKLRQRVIREFERGYREFRVEGSRFCQIRSYHCTFELVLCRGVGSQPLQSGL